VTTVRTAETDADIEVRDSRGRAVALALKQAQIAAAKEAGWSFLRTQNDLANAAMRSVNEKLGYERNSSGSILSARSPKADRLRPL
jgi:hypothetical protein